MEEQIQEVEEIEESLTSKTTCPQGQIWSDSQKKCVDDPG